jgi:hypothetical protein
LEITNASGEPLTFLYVTLHAKEILSWFAISTCSCFTQQHRDNFYHRYPAGFTKLETGLSICILENIITKIADFGSKMAGRSSDFFNNKKLHDFKEKSVGKISF